MLVGAAEFNLTFSKPVKWILDTLRPAVSSSVRTWTVAAALVGAEQADGRVVTQPDPQQLLRCFLLPLGADVTPVSHPVKNWQSQRLTFTTPAAFSWWHLRRDETCWPPRLQRSSYAQASGRSAAQSEPTSITFPGELKQSGGNLLYFFFSPQRSSLVTGEVTQVNQPLLC